MGEITKLVANRQSNAHVVTTALEVHAKAAAASVSALLFPKGEPKQLTVEMLVDALGKTLTAQAETIGAADRALADELGDDQPHRDARDAARAEVRAALTDCQSSVSGAYGASVVHAYALDGALPAADNLLLQQARVVQAALVKGAPKEAAKKGRKLDFAALAEDLQARIAAFDGALQNVKREEREAEQALTKRDAAVAAFEPVYTGVADIAAGLLELAGQADLASRVKPTVRRRAGLDPAPAEPTPAATAASTTTPTTQIGRMWVSWRPPCPPSPSAPPSSRRWRPISSARSLPAPPRASPTPRARRTSS